MAAIVVARRRQIRERMVEGRGFFPHLLIYLECQKNTLSEHMPSHVIFNLLQEIKYDLEPSTRRQAIPGLSKLHATLNFLASGSFQRTVASLFLYSLFATMLICAALGILRWSICKLDVASVFFNLCVVSTSPAEISMPIGAILELRSRANLPCLVKLALCQYMQIKFYLLIYPKS